MTPATHAAVAAVLASRIRPLPVALAAAFASHFLIDVVYHFEAFYPVSVLGKWSVDHTTAGIFALLGLLGLPLLVWIFRHDRVVGAFACYALLLASLTFETRRGWRLVWMALFSAGWIAWGPNGRLRRWVLCSFVALLPDLLKKFNPALMGLHDWFHYDPRLRIGDWLSLLLRGRWRLHPNYQIYDPCYVAGYIVEVLLEGVILWGCLYWLARRPPSADQG